MLICHTSDWHLGHRHAEMTRVVSGRNAHELDVLAAADALVGQLITLQPDLVLLAGDVLHTRAPARHVLLDAQALFARLARGLPDALIVVIAGNHDIGTSPPATCVLPVFAAPNVRVVVERPERIPWRDAVILAWPHGMSGVSGAAPVADAAINVLLWHGALRGIGPAGKHSVIEIDAAPWTYCAIGDYHVRADVWPNGGYSGSTSWTSSNIWGEIAAGPKGFCSYNVATGARSFHALPSRPVLDLPKISAHGKTPEDVGQELRAAVGALSADAVVRQVVLDAAPGMASQLDRVKREICAELFAYVLDVRRAQPMVTAGVRGRYGSLSDHVRAFAQTWQLSPGIDPAAFNALQEKYLREAQAAEAPPPDELEVLLRASVDAGRSAA